MGDSRLSISRSTFRQSTASAPGGAILYRGSQLEISGSIFEDSESTSAPGGAIFHTVSDDIFESSFLSIHSSRFTNSTARGVGGAISSEAKLIGISESSFENSQASAGAAVVPE